MLSEDEENEIWVDFMEYSLIHPGVTYEEYKQQFYPQLFAPPVPKAIQEVEVDYEMEPSLLEEMLKQIPPHQPQDQAKFEIPQWQTEMLQSTAAFSQQHNMMAFALYDVPEAIRIPLGCIYGIQLHVGKKIRVFVEPEIASDKRIEATLIADRTYVVVVRQNQSFRLTCVGEHRQPPAVVRIFTFSATEETYPEIPLRENESFTLIAAPDINYQFRRFPNFTVNEMQTLEPQYVLPLLFVGSEKEPFLCETNVKIQLRVGDLKKQRTAGMNYLVGKQLTLVTRESQLDVLAAQMNTGRLFSSIAWQQHIHQMNEDIRITYSLQATLFPTGDVLKLMPTGVLNAFLVFPGKCKTIIEYHLTQRMVFNVTVMSGFEYVLLRRANERWIIQCAPSQPQSEKPALIRVISASENERVFIPIRSHRPAFLLARPGSDYMVLIIPEMFDNRLLPKIDLRAFPPLLKQCPPAVQILRLELVTLYTIQVVSDDATAVAQIFITDVFGTNEPNNLRNLIEPSQQPYSPEALQRLRASVEEEHYFGE